MHIFYCLFLCIFNNYYKEKLRVMLSGNDVPDLFFTWDGDYIQRFAKAGVIMNLDEMLAVDPDFKNAFNQGLLTTGQYDGSQYGLPIRTCVNFILYYKDKFEQYNLEEPQTWDEFMSLCNVLKDNGEIPLMLGNLNGSPLTHWMAALNLMLVDPETLAADYYLETGDFTDPGYITTLETLKSMLIKPSKVVVAKAQMAMSLNKAGHNSSVRDFNNYKILAFKFVQL